MNNEEEETPIYIPIPAKDIELLLEFDITELEKLFKDKDE